MARHEEELAPRAVYSIRATVGVLMAPAGMAQSHHVHVEEQVDLLKI